ncbi:MAG: 2-C-methyl-D-erythritol 2,4-cyclodiphosphate synthase [Halanaerobiaceae bacterium]
MRVGMGFDVHRFSDNQDLVLGGVEIPCSRGLKGHSDADVLVHALMDALLGAAAAGDIGDHFPPDDDRYKGISSLVLLARVTELLQEKGFVINNVDLTIIAQIPRVAPYKEKMVDKISSTLKLTKNRINIKATTTEGLGFVGRKQGIAAQVVATIAKKDSVE